MSKGLDKITSEIVRKIILDISDRRGFRQTLESIDVDIQREIKNSWKKIIKDEIKEIYEKSWQYEGLCK